MIVVSDTGPLRCLIDFRAAVERLTTRTRLRHTKELIAQVVANYEREWRDRVTARD